MDIKQTVKNTIISKKLINPGDYVFLGLSGGPDSLCLLHVLMELRTELGFELAAIHVHHGIRGEEADADAQWVLDHCKELGVSCTRVMSNVPMYAKRLHLTEEEAGRRVRREIFAYMAYGMIAENINERHPAKPLREAYAGPNGIYGLPGGVRIAVAHNMDDQAETVLMRIMRGTGTRGLAGIRYNSPLTDALKRVSWGIKNPLLAQNAQDLDISMVRPLLDVPRAEIELYCRDKGLQPRIDRTNSETDYTRNRIRIELLPMLEKNFNPGVKQALVRLAANAQEDDEALAALTAEASARAEKLLGLAPPDPDYEKKGPHVRPLLSSVSLDAAVLRSLPPAVFKRLITEEFEKLGLFEGISAVHLNTLHSAVAKNVGGKVIEFPGGHTAELRAGTLTLK